MAGTRGDARLLAGIPVEVRWAAVPPAPDASPPEPDEAATATARDALTPFEFDRYRSFRPAAASAFLAGRLLLRDLVAALAGVDPAEVALEARCPVCGGTHGRPAVVAPARATALQLGLAHAGAMVVAAAAWEHPVGIDVERTDAAHTPERNRAIIAVAGASASSDALEHWTRVEAVLKADGRGLRVDPRRVRIRETGDTVEAWVDDPGTRYALASLDLGTGLTATVAVSAAVADAPAEGVAATVRR